MQAVCSSVTSTEELIELLGLPRLECPNSQSGCTYCVLYKLFAFDYVTKAQRAMTITDLCFCVGRPGVDLLLAVLGNYSDSSLVQ